MEIKGRTQIKGKISGYIPSWLRRFTKKAGMIAEEKTTSEISDNTGISDITQNIIQTVGSQSVAVQSAIAVATVTATVAGGVGVVSVSKTVYNNYVERTNNIPISLVQPVNDVYENIVQLPIVQNEKKEINIIEEKKTEVKEEVEEVKPDKLERLEEELKQPEVDKIIGVQEPFFSLPVNSSGAVTGGGGSMPPYCTFQGGKSFYK